MKNNKKGFTLAELLVVVAIIAVLVAIAIPVFGGAVAKANHAADLASVRATYAEEVVKAMTGDSFDGGDITISKTTLSDAAKNGSTVTCTDGKKVEVKLNSYSGEFPVDDNVKFGA